MYSSDPDKKEPPKARFSQDGMQILAYAVSVAGDKAEIFSQFFYILNPKHVKSKKQNQFSSFSKTL